MIEYIPDFRYLIRSSALISSACAIWIFINPNAIKSGTKTHIEEKINMPTTYTSAPTIYSKKVLTAVRMPFLKISLSETATCNHLLNGTASHPCQNSTVSTGPVKGSNLPSHKPSLLSPKYSFECVVASTSFSDSSVETSMVTAQRSPSLSFSTLSTLMFVKIRVVPPVPSLE